MSDQRDDRPGPGWQGEQHPDHTPTQPIVGGPGPQHAQPPHAQAQPQHAEPPQPQPAWTRQQYPAGPAPRPPKGRVPGWLWPLVALLALLVGLTGGVVGGAAYQQYRGSGIDMGLDGPSSSSSDGLDSGATVTDAPLPAGNGSVPRVARKMLPSTVQILATWKDNADGATGSGFVLDTQGHIVTNNHVVAEAASSDGNVEVVDQSGEKYGARVVGRSPVYDLAVLHVKAARDMPPAALGDSESLVVGEGVVAFGSPLGLSSTVTSGIVSALDRPVTTGNSEDDSSYINAVQTDAAINPGNSGGPLVNMRGQVVGVNSAIATSGGALGGSSGNIGVGFAIPMKQVRITADQILRDGEARYPVIGATVQTGGTSTEGAQVKEVLPDSPAAAAGLEPGDVVTHVDDQRVPDGIALIVAIRTHQPGEKVQFTLERKGDERKVTITLDSKVG